MSFGLLILRNATQQLATLPSEAYTDAVQRIHQLAIDPLPPSAERVAGREGWRLRVGDYRVIYEVDMPAARVTILDVARRSDV